ncbi:iron ABC transporter permease [Halalkalibacterium halodurans]|uniref:iron chelate uptake ABC transporter family permease subunit n=1 Tax=Halalkalibacterium halodurans TaxID=86665 RepID=UPI001067C2F1|nr:iron chelate uptake ABC transporter family permease subunit [Halalkalibacterium halodurans]TES56144.1 iron ABC transporter permease [Halalkalibacterium halodurans]
MGFKAKIISLTVLNIVLIGLFLTIGVNNWEYALPRRGASVAAIAVTGAAIAFSTVVFQTITNNRILTPSIIGLDSLYMLIQTFIIFVFGSTSFLVIDRHVNFLLSVGMMILFAGLFYKLLFRREGQHLFLLLLIGLVLGTLFSSLSTFMQVLIDPNEFQTVQNRMFASFNNINTDLLYLAIALFIGITIYCYKYFKFLDVLSLGREHAVNLGIPYDSVIKRLLIVVAIFISIATALVGPITFLGLLVANVAYEFMRTHKHREIIIGAILISTIALIGGQLIVQHVFTFSTPLSVIINFIGGVYFLYLLLKENKKW